MASTEGFFALCMYRYRGPDETHLNVSPGSLVVVWRVEASGWAGALDLEGGWGWVPFGYVRPIDDETVGVLEPIAQQLRLGAFRAMTAIRATATDLEGYSSPDSNESDALGDEWTNIPKPRRSSRAVSRPRDMDTNTNAPLDEAPHAPDGKSPGQPAVQFAAPSPPSAFAPRVRAFRLRSKSRDGARSDSESSRPRRPSVSLRRTRASMFGSPREPNPADHIARLAARPWYLQPRHSPLTGDIVLDPDGSVRAGTLEAIAERLTCDPPSRSYELALRRAVLFTYEAFTTSQRLFDLVTDQYSLDPPRELDEIQFVEWKESRLRPTQARVLDVLGMWLELPRLYQDDPELVLRIRDFLQFVTKPDNLALEARAHLRTIERLITPLTPHRPPTPQRPRRRTPKQRPFPTLSPSSRSNSLSGSLLLSPTSSTVRPGSPHSGLGHSSPVQGYASPVQGYSTPVQGYASPIPSSASPRRGFASPRSGAASPSVNHRASTPSLSPGQSMSSTSMTSLPSALANQQQAGGARLGRAKSQRHASATYSRSETKQTDSFNTAISGSSYASSVIPGNRPSGVASLDPTALAHHLTLLESSLYMRVKRIQCLEWHKAGRSASKAADDDSNTPPEETNDLRAFCSTSDRLAGWVKWSVLSLNTSTQRAEAVGVWVRVAEKCRLLNNTSSLCAIVAGLSSADISRLPYTWHLVPSARTQRLEDLARLTSPAGGFAALKLLYVNGGCGVPFVGMYLTALVHTADQFKDYIPAPSTQDTGIDKEQRKDEGEEEALSEPVTPIQTRSTFISTPSTRSSLGSSPPLVGNASPTIPRTTPPTLHDSPRIVRSLTLEPRTPTLPPSSPTTSTLPTQKLINFTKRHKQTEIIGAMLKFQSWPYTVVPMPMETSAGGSPPLPVASSASGSSSAAATLAIYPYPPSPSPSLTLNAAAGGVAWVEEQLARAARITLGTDWTYERSLRLYDEETGERGLDKILMAPAGF